MHAESKQLCSEVYCKVFCGQAPVHCDLPVPFVHATVLAKTHTDCTVYLHVGIWLTAAAILT